MPVSQMALKMARNMLPSLVINAICPLLIYIYLRRLYPDPSILPISVAALFPVVGNVYSLARYRSLDTFGSVMLLGFVFTIGAIFLSGDQRIILISRSLLTLGMGLLSLLSLLFPRTISFYFARQFMTGNQPDQAREFNAYWGLPYVRHVSRVTSLIWGVALVAEFLFRVLIVYTQPITRVLVLTPIVFNIISMSTMLWTAWYGTRAVRRIRHQTAPIAADRRA